MNDAPFEDPLEALGVHVQPADAAVLGAVRDGLTARSAGAGRLIEVAAWWAAARGSHHAGPPREARSLCLGCPPDALPLDPPYGATVTRATPGVPQDIRAALEWGVSSADAAADAGADVLLLTVCDDTNARILAACLMGQDVVEALGWPQESGVDDETWMGMAVTLRDGLARLRGLRGEPFKLLCALDSPRLAAMSALIVQSAARRTPMILDGYGALICAVLALRVSRAVQDWYLVPHAGRGGRYERALRSLSADPLLSLGITAEDGSAALLGLGLLETACGLLAA